MTPKERVLKMESAINDACEIIEQGDLRLLASDGPAGGQPPDISLLEWRKMYRTLNAARRLKKGREKGNSTNEPSVSTEAPEHKSTAIGICSTSSCHREAPHSSECVTSSTALETDLHWRKELPMPDREPTPRHQHDLKRVAIKGMGFATYRCECGYETDGRYDDKAEVEELEAKLREKEEECARLTNEVKYLNASITGKGGWKELQNGSEHARHKAESRAAAAEDVIRNMLRHATGDKDIDWIIAHGSAFLAERDGKATDADTFESASQRAWREHPTAGRRRCDLHEVPAGCDAVQWYWSRHTRVVCTMELPNLKCWCGRLRSEHLDGHALDVVPSLETEAGK